MSGGESIVRTLVGVRESAESAHLAVSGKSLAASGKELVAVGLMSDVPHDAVVGCVENIVKCYGKLHGAHAGCEVAGIDREGVDEEAANLVAYLRQLCRLQASEVGRGVDALKQGISFGFRSIVHPFLIYFLYMGTNMMIPEATITKP